MKYLLFCILLLLTLCSCSTWTKRDIGLGMGAVALTAIDWNQTLQVADDPEYYAELNPILGRHPSRGDVNLYFASSLAIGWAVCEIFPSLRPYVIGGWIGVEGIKVVDNWRIGLAPGR